MVFEYFFVDYAIHYMVMTQRITKANNLKESRQLTWDGPKSRDSSAEAIAILVLIRQRGYIRQPLPPSGWVAVRDRPPSADKGQLKYNQY